MAGTVAIDALLWSSLWLAAAATVLTAAGARSLGLEPAPGLLCLAFGGTLVVYVLDRLRDLERDRARAPLRAAFVEGHRSAMIGLAAAGGTLAAACALGLRPAALILTAAVAALGFAHRRLKGWLLVKPAYLTFAWTAVPVGIPAANDPAAEHVGAVAFVVATTVLANVALSNLRDGEGLAGQLGQTRTIGLATVLLVAGALAALMAAPPVRPLLAVPIAMGIAVAGFRPSERYGAAVVDGALGIGALAALSFAAA
jgi:hypothetical protein